MEGVILLFLFKKIIFEASLTLERGSFQVISSYVLESSSILTVLCIFSLPMQNHEFPIEDVIAISLS